MRPGAGLAAVGVGAVLVDVVQVVGGERTPVTEAHVRYEGDELRRFTDCGDPV